MEYTKDMILQVNYGQGTKNKGKGKVVLDKVTSSIARHRVMTAIITLTMMLIVLDIMLITSFVQVLAGMI